MQSFASWYAPHMLAGCLDFCTGILITIVLWQLLFKEQPTFGAMFAGGALALLPDIDLLWDILVTGAHTGDHHQLITHFPGFMLVVVPPVAGYVSWLWGNFWRGYTLAFCCLLWHFVHDTPGGIAWLWPLSNEYYGSSQWVRALAEGHVAKVWAQPSLLASFELVLSVVVLAVAAWRRRSRAYAALAAVIVVGVWGTTLYIWSPHLPALGGMAVASP